MRWRWFWVQCNSRRGYDSDIRKFIEFWGRIYVAGVAAGAPLGIVLAFVHDLPIALRVETFAQSGSWFLTTAVALYYILHRNVIRHRQWMLRSYLFTSIFVVSRVLDKVPYLGSLIAPFNSGSNPAILWFLVLFAWVIPTFTEQKEELLGTR